MHVSLRCHFKANKIYINPTGGTIKYRYVVTRNLLAYKSKELNHQAYTQTLTPTMVQGRVVGNLLLLAFLLHMMLIPWDKHANAAAEGQ